MKNQSPVNSTSIYNYKEKARQRISKKKHKNEIEKKLQQKITVLFDKVKYVIKLNRK